MTLEQKKLKTIPISKSEFESAYRKRDASPRIIPILKRAPTNAQSPTSKPPRPEAKPNTSAAEAKSAAPDEIPRVNGLAK
jgi:hypothetical protein